MWVGLYFETQKGTCPCCLQIFHIKKFYVGLSVLMNVGIVCMQEFDSI